MRLLVLFCSTEALKNSVAFVGKIEAALGAAEVLSAGKIDEAGWSSSVR